MNKKWYYQVMGDTFGPVDMMELHRLVASNDILRETFVRKEGDGWMLADRVEGLFSPLRPPRQKIEPQWYFRVMGEIHGPIPQSALRRLAAQNDINRDTFVRRDDEEWVTADRVQGLLS